MKGAQQSLVESLPEPHVASDPIVEPVHDVLAVCPLRSCGQAQQVFGFTSLKEPTICGCFRVVELVNDHDVPSLGVDCVDRPAKGLDRGEHVLAVDRSLCPDMALAKVRVLQNDAEYLLALTQDFITMGNEEQPFEALRS